MSRKFLNVYMIVLQLNHDKMCYTIKTNLVLQEIVK